MRSRHFAGIPLAMVGRDEGMSMWYGVDLLFEGCHPGQAPETNLWEERIVLLDAASDDEARQQAELHGKSEEHEYTSATGELVQWRYRGLERIYAIDSTLLESGTEVFSRFLHASEVASLRRPCREDAATA